MDEEKFGLKVEDGEEEKEEDDYDLEVSDKDVDRTNDNGITSSLTTLNYMKV